MSKRLSEEEKVARKLSAIASDLRLDLDLVGQYLARMSPSVSVSRLILIVDSAEYEKNSKFEPNPMEVLF